jgi:NTE family protein
LRHQNRRSKYSSRNRAATDQYKKAQRLRVAFANLIKQLPDRLRNSEDVKILAQEADDKVCNIADLTLGLGKVVHDYLA